MRTGPRHAQARPRGAWRDRPNRTLPPWVTVALGSLATGAALVWSSGLRDDAGAELLDEPTSKVLVALLGAAATLLSLLIQRTAQIKHELRPNSGSSARDAIDRSEATSAATAHTVDQLVASVAHLERTHREQAGHHAALRQDVQALRRDVSGTADDIRAVREDIGRLTSLITKGTS